jgi:steroid delta-isomerase-like uncharacterized protein
MATSEATDAGSVARSYFEAVGRRDLEAMTAHYAPGGTGEIYGLVRLEVPTSYRHWFGDLFRAFPDFEFEIVEIVASGEKAAVRWRAGGSFDGDTPFEGLQPNGARVAVQGCDVLSVRDGRIQRNDAYMNGAEMMRQLGALPPQGSAAERATLAALNLKTRLLAGLRRRQTR